MKPGRLLFCLAISVFPLRLHAADNLGRSKEPSAFLNLGIGVRSAGMGKAVTSVSDDISAAYWNPSGLSQLRTYELQTMSSSLGLDRSFYFVGLGIPIRGYWDQSDLDYVEEEENTKPSKFFLPIARWNISLAFGSAIYRVDRIDRRDDFGNKQGEFSDVEYVYFFSMGHDVLEDVSLGYTYRYHVQRLENSSAKGGGFDIGLTYHPSYLRVFKAGITAMNVIAGQLTWKAVDSVGITDEYEESMPRKINLGLSYRFRIPDLILSLDLHTSKDETPTTHGGVEFKPVRFLALRGGVSQQTPSFGFGFLQNVGEKFKIALDYAYVFGIDVVQESHRFSLTLLY